MDWRWLRKIYSWFASSRPPIKRPVRRRGVRSLSLETLESRRVFSATTLKQLPIPATTVTTDSANPTDIVSAGSIAYFVANDGIHGQQLWESINGSSAATNLVQVIGSGGPGAYPTQLTNVNGTLFFTDDVGGTDELWTSNGSSSGTSLVSSVFNALPTDLTAVGSLLLFSANDGIHGQALWKSDGTSTGTAMIGDIALGTSGSNSPDLTEVTTNVHGSLTFNAFFSAPNGTNGTELWSSDGTSEGTLIRSNFDLVYGAGASSITSLTAVGSTLFFVADESTYGNELWEFNAAANASSTSANLVSDINSNPALPPSPGTASSNPTELTNVGGTLYFLANDGNTPGNQLWSSDGTSAGTVKIASFDAGASYQYQLMNAGGTLFFTMDDGTSGLELWTSTGGQGNATLVSDIDPGPLGSNPDLLGAIGSTIFFAANDGTHGEELWRSSGTSAGTTMLENIGPGYDSGLALAPQAALLGNALLFAANDGTHGTELWLTAGTSSTTHMVSDINTVQSGPVVTPQQLNANSNQGTFVPVGSLAFFVANDGVHGAELWVTRGSSSTSAMVTDIAAGAAGSYPSYLTNVNGTLFFTADDGIHGDQLWESNGTPLGTVMLADINPLVGSQAAPPIQYLTNVSGTLFFTADDGTHGTELWESNGTCTGTVMVDDIDSGVEGSYPTELTNVSGTLFFAANDGTTGYQLWQSNGTSTGTLLVDDINTTVRTGTNKFDDTLDNAFPSSLTNVNGTLFFFATDGSSINELWQSNGTSTGTALVDSISNSGSVGMELTNVNGTVFFLDASSVSTAAAMLWESNGTSAGTVQVSAVAVDAPTPVGMNPRGLPVLLPSVQLNIVNVNGTIFFAGQDSAHGTELWSSNGTSTGTSLVSDIQAGANGSYPEYLTNVAGTLFFVANDGAHGVELWRSDGTSSGTVLAGDIDPGKASGNPVGLTNFNGTLLFAASAGNSQGLQPYVYGRSLNLVGSAAGDTITVNFTTATNFTLTANGTATAYNTNSVNNLSFSGVSGATETVIVNDPFNSYSAFVGQGSVQMTSSAFNFSATNAQSLYIYANKNSTAAVSVPSGPNFFVGVANPDYAYEYDTSTGVFTEAAGFGQLTATGSGGSTYAYFYSTTDASLTLSPTVGGTMRTSSISESVSGFPQVYGVGASDGTDTIAIDSGGGKFVATPLYSYATNTSDSYFLGALYFANVVAEASVAGTDSAYIYSYGTNALAASPQSTTLTGSDSKFANFSITVAGYPSVVAWSAGAGTDTDTLSSSGGSTFVGYVSTSGSSPVTVGLLTQGAVTVEVVGYANITATGGGTSGTDVAYLYDAAGANALLASGTSASLTNQYGVFSLNNFSGLIAVDAKGTGDTEHVGSLDYSLQSDGPWVSI